MRKIQENTKGDLLKVGEVAEILHVSPQTVRDWTEANKLTAVISDGGHRQYYEADVKRLKLENEGVTTFWELYFTVNIDGSGNVQVLNTEFSDLDAPEDVNEVSFSNWWNFTNGLQTINHDVALKGSHINQIKGRDVYQMRDKTSSQLTVGRYVGSVDKAWVAAQVPSLVEETLAWVKENYQPVTIIIWVDKKTNEDVPLP